MISHADFLALLHAFPAGWPRPLCMGILNITPDSFHDGGAYLDPAAALAQMTRLVDMGADLIDIGGMSSRPGHTELSAAAEWARLEPVLRQAARVCPAPLSVDTDKAEVAEAALAHGVSVINYCGGRQNAQIYALAAQSKAPLIVMHRAGTAGAHDEIVEEVAGFFRVSLQAAEMAGVQPWQLVFDPGLGFEKDIAENLALLRATPQLAAMGRPLLLGYSHKRFVAALSGERHGAAPLGNCALAAYAVLHGAHIVRVHEAEPFVAIARTLSGIQAEENDGSNYPA